MKKLMKRELEVLSSVICKRVEEEKKKVLEGKLKKSKEYLSLVKEGESIEKLVEELRKRGDSVSERVSMLNRKLGLGGNKGCVSWSGFSSYGSNKVSCSMGYINRRDIEDKLILKNLGGEVDVEEIVKEMIKELV
jgi:hypothetical protein